MNYFILFLLISLCIEIINLTSLSSLLKNLFKLTQKSIYILTNKKVSDHWKEKFIPNNSIRMIKNSLLILLIFLLISTFLLISVSLSTKIYELIFSLNGFIASFVFGFVYLYSKRFFKKSG